MVRQAIRLRIASRERLMFADLVSMKRMCASTKTHSGQHHIALSWPLSVCMSARAAFRSSPLRVNMSAVCSCIYLHLLVVHVEYYSVRSGTTLILHRIPNLLRRLRLLRQVGLLWGCLQRQEPPATSRCCAQPGEASKRRALGADVLVRTTASRRTDGSKI